MAVDMQQTTIVYLPITKITDRLPVRRLSANGVKRLRESIKRNGFMDIFPLVVAPLGNDNFRLLEGSHRLTAAEEEGLSVMPCVIKVGLSENEQYKLAIQSNNAAETMVPPTLVHHAEFIWNRSDEGKTLEEIASDILVGWSLDKVKKYSALRQIKSEAWAIIVPTFESIGHSLEEDEGTIEVPTGTFTERLLRDIYSLMTEQQLELVKALVHTDKNKRITKARFTELAKAYKSRNEMKKYALQQLGDLGEPYTTQLIEAVYSGAYDTDWKHADHPKLHRLLQSLREEWEQKNSIHLTHGDFYEEVKKIGDGCIDLILTDPPYNVASEREFAMEGRSNISQDFGDWDKYEHQAFVALFDIWVREWARILRDGGSGYVFTSDIYLSHLREALERAGLTVKTAIAWHKTNPSPQFEQTTFQSSVEYILFFVKGQGYTFHWLGNSDGMMHNFIETPVCGGNERLKDAKGDTLHPTQKPVRILRHLMQVSSNRGDLVFDGFAGVGSTGKAAKDLGCKFTGIEQNKKFFDAMQRELADD